MGVGSAADRDAYSGQMNPVGVARQVRAARDVPFDRQVRDQEGVFLRQFLRAFPRVDHVAPCLGTGGVRVGEPKPYGPIREGFVRHPDSKPSLRPFKADRAYRRLARVPALAEFVPDMEHVGDVAFAGIALQTELTPGAQVVVVP
jgi:hypothetical protein